MSSVDFNGITGIQSSELDDSKSSAVNERLTKKILELIKGEIAKSETQQKLRCAVDPIIAHISGVVQPYVLMFVITIFLILIFQAYTIHKMWCLQRSLRD